MDENMIQENEHSISFMQLVVVTGFVGGIMWSLIAYLAYFFQFTKIEPNILLEPFTVGNWKETWIGIVITIFVYGILSIGVAFLYFLILRKLYSMWVGVFYGVALFLIVFFILNPIFPSMKPFFRIDSNTIITSVCIYVLYGVFIGYSISFEQSNIVHRKRQKEKNRM
ncbi:YqhR family membrane protein [Heyndrickxia acidicola]|uniref:YqhR family membrane protein n=1 Tax=Heyndrickxia acidicola TaxID=209389 RepID=A0ABU6MKE9_9BACI|nr:YqhR family membrane protein [Heyndrickxia acidicola]MED1205163.1 YqhR family membrane protein [Heyndrickxia acidicola]